MKQVVTGWDHIFGPWLMERARGAWYSGHGRTIGLFDDQTNHIYGAVLFESYNGASMLLHCAGDGKNWLTREFLWYVFYYPFEELGVRKLISPIDSDNSKAIKFIENIGFCLEGTLLGASPKGNLLIYTMRPDQCRWHLKERANGQGTGSAGSSGLCSSSAGAGSGKS